MPKAQPQRFADVPPSHPFFAEIEDVAERGIMGEYGAGVFGVNDPLLRFQAAVAIEKTLGVFNPPEMNGNLFDDIYDTGDDAKLINDFAARGITVGCAPRLFCPYQATTREQMAAFIMRARGEFDPAPPYPGTFRFLDVPESNPFYAFIHRLQALGITNGCGGGNYCPASPVTRGQMAAFISRSFPQ